MTPFWYALHDTSAVISPSLLVYPERILHNIRVMIEMAGGTKYLRPHIKTHKTAEIVKMQLEQGIHKFKCATIAEAELLAQCGALDILLAMQPVGVDMERFFRLMDAYPDAKFSALVDNVDTLKAFSEMAASRSASTIQHQDSHTSKAPPSRVRSSKEISGYDNDLGVSPSLSEKMKSKGPTVSLWMDLNTGMDRTGIVPDQDAVDLYRQMNANPYVTARGLHAYDGHIRNPDVTERENICNQAFASVSDLKKRLEAEGISVGGIVAGGSPTFPFHARRAGVEASPGTTLLWDAGYGGLFPEMEFLPAAVLLTRVISKPAKNVICLDLGHKHLASEMPFPRVKFLGMDFLGMTNTGRQTLNTIQKNQRTVQNGKRIVQKGQSEEHFVLEVEDSADFRVGDILYAVPMHICPTVAKYDVLQVVSEKQIINEWKVAARNQRLTV